MNEIPFVVVATFPDGTYYGSEMRRYADGQYWHTWKRLGVPAQRMSMHLAAVRVVYHGGVVVPDVPIGKRFRTEVAKIRREDGAPQAGEGN